ncbi:unnamed protein product [Lactuca saligna]|uniref:Uncharacterized protein n=1 Tax=Lactuca saligna TaxID=75948 RepID=A0AA36DZJ6_LACSI|nr:unnamed protein product [Lactuca saligna]
MVLSDSLRSNRRLLPQRGEVKGFQGSIKNKFLYIPKPHQFIKLFLGSDYIRTQADFVWINLEEIFLIARVFSDLICDFGKINAEIHPILAKKFKFPYFEPAPSFIEGYQSMSLKETNFPELGAIYKIGLEGPKYFILVTAMHRLAKKQLDITLALVQRSMHTTKEAKFEITRRIHWLSEVIFSPTTLEKTNFTISLYSFSSGNLIPLRLQFSLQLPFSSTGFSPDFVIFLEQMDTMKDSSDVLSFNLHVLLMEPVKLQTTHWKRYQFIQRKVGDRTIDMAATTIDQVLLGRK